MDGPSRPLLLIGMMLSGKSTVGRLLAAHLDCPFIDLDDAIVERSGRDIPALFTLGEPIFRALERDTLAAVLSDGGPVVIAAGGGALEDSRSRELALATAHVIFLDASIETLADRHRLGSGRPLLDNEERPLLALASILDRRRCNYERAHTRVSVDDRTPEEIAEEIADVVASHS